MPTNDSTRVRYYQIELELCRMMISMGDIRGAEIRLLALARDEDCSIMIRVLAYMEMIRIGGADFDVIDGYLHYIEVLIDMLNADSELEAAQICQAMVDAVRRAARSGDA